MSVHTHTVSQWCSVGVHHSTGVKHWGLGSQGSEPALSPYLLHPNLLTSVLPNSTYQWLWVISLSPAGLGAQGPEDYLVPPLCCTWDTACLTSSTDAQLSLPHQAQSVGQTDTDKEWSQLGWDIIHIRLRWDCQISKIDDSNILLCLWSQGLTLSISKLMLMIFTVNEWLLL